MVREPRDAGRGEPAGHRAGEHVRLPARAARSASPFPTRSRWMSSRWDTAPPMTTKKSTAATPPARNEPYIEVTSSRRCVSFEEQPRAGPQLVLAWPKESERRIVTLRVIPKKEPRFSGRALRQAFAGAGFWHGPLDHLSSAAGERSRARERGRACAARAPSIPSIMDSQRFSGLNLFSVLPGSRSERELVRRAGARGPACSPSGSTARSPISTARS